MRKMNSQDNAETDNAPATNAATSPTSTQAPPVKPRLTTHRERKIHRHIREIARPRSQDRSMDNPNMSTDEARYSGHKDDSPV